MTNNYNYIKTILIQALLAMLLIACKKDIVHKENLPKVQSEHSSKRYILGIRKISGEVDLFKESNVDTNWLVYNGDILIHKQKVEPIKTYNKIDKDIVKEIDILKKQHKNNGFLRTDILPPLIDTGYNIIREAILWPDNKVKISISPDFDPQQIQRIRDAIEEWTSNTNIEITEYPFEPREPEVTEFRLDRENPIAARSSAGANNHPDWGAVHLGSRVGTHVIIHELGHVIGFGHEHQRPCRDHHLKLYESTFMVIEAHNPDPDRKLMEELKSSIIDITPVHNDDYRFDFNSIMIYESYGGQPIAFGTDAPGNPLRAYLISRNMPMFVRKDNGDIIEDIFALSVWDIQRTNKVYPAPGTCPAR